MSKLFPENIRKAGLFPLSLGDQGRDYFATALKRLDYMGVNFVVSFPEGGEYRFFAWRDRERAENFNRLLADDSIDLLFAIRGGVGRCGLLSSSTGSCFSDATSPWSATAT